MQLRSDVGEHVGLPITVGVARTKFLAKVASGVAKPDGLLVVPPDGELAFLHPLPVERLWGVGHVTAGKLHGRGIRTVGQVAQIPQEALVYMLGRASGRHLHALAHNRDPRPVQVGRRRGSIGSQHALGRRTPRTWEAVDVVVIGLVDRVTRRMRAAGRVGRTVVLRLRFDDFSRVTRSHTLPRATSHTQTILATVQLAAGGRDAADREAWAHARRDCGRESRGRQRHPARPAVRSRGAASPSTRHSTRCASGSARPPSPGRP